MKKKKFGIALAVMFLVLIGVWSGLGARKELKEELKSGRQWVTNIPIGESVAWCAFKDKKIGRPKATKEHSVEELEGMGVEALYAIRDCGENPERMDFLTTVLGVEKANDLVIVR